MTFYVSHFLCVYASIHNGGIEVDRAYLSYDIRDRCTTHKKAVLVFQEDTSMCPGLKKGAKHPVSS